MQSDNFISDNRGFIVLKRHLPMLLKPLVFALAMVLVWQFLRSHGMYLSKESEGPLTAGVIPVIGLIYGIKAAAVLTSVWDEYKIISFSVVKKDKETFLLHRDEQIPIMIHLLLAVVALILLALVMVVNYSEIWAGRIAVFSVAFVLMIMRIIAIELDDPKNSIWFQKRIPASWLSADVEEYFSERAPKEN